MCSINKIDNIRDLVTPVSVFLYRRFTLSDFSKRRSGAVQTIVL